MPYRANQASVQAFGYVFQILKPHGDVEPGEDLCRCRYDHTLKGSESGSAMR